MRIWLAIVVGLAVLSAVAIAMPTPGADTGGTGGLETEAGSGPTTTAGINTTAAAEATVTAVNEFRADEGRPRLTTDPTLTARATRYSSRLAAAPNTTVTHTLDGDSARERYGCPAGEALVAPRVQESIRIHGAVREIETADDLADAALEWWRLSPPHRQVLLEQYPEGRVGVGIDITDDRATVTWAAC